jgi:DNA modification methylase
MSQIESVGGPAAVAQDDLSGWWRMHHRDARKTGDLLSETARRLGRPGEPFLSATITSPPYANLVDYGSEEQIGFGQSFDTYLSELRVIFEDLFRWTKSDGALWLVVDTLTQRATGSLPGRLVPLPFILADLASEAGWSLREVIIWRKDRTRPWSSKGRLRNGFEYVLFLVKSSDYKYHLDRLRDLRGLKSWWVKYPERHNPWGMAPDNVWEIPIPVQGSWATSELRHACPLPEELIRRIVKLSTDESDVIFDPFGGSGMVLATAETEGRLPLGTELNPRFIDAYEAHIRPQMMSKLRPDVDFELGDLTGKLLTLRVLKYPKDLMKQLLLAGVPRKALLGAVVTAEAFDTTPRTSKYGVARVLLVLDRVDETVNDEPIRAAIDRAVSKPPLSKYGLDVKIDIAAIGELSSALEPGEYALYSRGKTWAANRSMELDNLSDLLKATDLSAFPPILSPLLANEFSTDH